MGQETSIFTLYLQTAALRNGESEWCRKQDVIELLRPELLSDPAKLQLSQIRPIDVADRSEHTPEYSGCSFLPDGRYELNTGRNKQYGRRLNEEKIFDSGIIFLKE